jgi:hypothetical protein
MPIYIVGYDKMINSVLSTSEKPSLGTTAPSREKTFAFEDAKNSALVGLDKIKLRPVASPLAINLPEAAPTEAEPLPISSYEGKKVAIAGVDDLLIVGGILGLALIGHFGTSEEARKGVSPEAARQLWNLFQDNLRQLGSSLTDQQKWDAAKKAIEKVLGKGRARENPVPNPQQRREKPLCAAQLNVRTTDMQGYTNVNYDVRVQSGAGNSGLVPDGVSFDLMGTNDRTITHQNDAFADGNVLTVPQYGQNLSYRIAPQIPNYTITGTGTHIEFGGKCFFKDPVTQATSQMDPAYRPATLNGRNLPQRTETRSSGVVQILELPALHR